jgi:hypothetical protein
MLHVVVFIRPIFVPDEIANESLDYELIFAELLKKVALSFKHGIVLELPGIFV